LLKRKMFVALTLLRINRIMETNFYNSGFPRLTCVQLSHTVQ
jgi:hypothetical protein